MTTTARDVLAVARELADDLLFPDAMRVDRLDVLPAAHLDALAAAGLYGAPVPVQAGGLGLDLVDQHAQRLVREAQFLLVFGSRPAIKSALLRRLGTARSAG
jgi:alkylation response protein AidB-like acyl-CoA dehydrogenase